ncbi:MAG: acetate uptake transporter [Desulfobacteraceae bacterium]|nr:acetate uptake transporter [Desulfobacteraceae bacterium]
MSEIKMGNPAVVGLAGFGMTTLILQFHNLGWVGLGPVLWLGILFGGTAQLIAGFLEFRTGNNFGFCAFSSYGAFWISLSFYLIFGSNKELVALYPVFKMSAHDLGIFLFGWTIFTGILFIASMKHNGTLALTFLTLFLGFVGLDFKELAGSQILGTLAAWDLILCALLAWYLMAAAIFAEAGIRLPVGAPWLK